MISGFQRTCAVLVILFGMSVVPAARPAGNTTLQVVRVTPSGDEVPVGRQVVVTFDRPVVPIGDMRAGAPAVTITPKLACHWHWLDPRSFACELDAADALAPASEYVVTVPAGLTAEDGTQLKETFRTSFQTERPVVKEYSFSTWRAPGTPVVRLVFNCPVTKDSVESHLSFSGQDRVHAEPDPYARVFYALPLPGEKAALVMPQGSEPVKSNDRAVVVQSDAGRVEARQVWLVSPPKELAEDLRAQLRVSPGLRGHLGNLLGREQRTVVEFDTFPAFRLLGVRCRSGKDNALIEVDNEIATAPRCNPLARVSLAFSAPIIASEIKEHLRLTPTLAGERTDYDPWANVWASSQLRQPHQRGWQYEVELPEHLRAFQDYAIAGIERARDEFGRLPVGKASMRFRTDHRPPRLRLSHPVAVLEKDVPSELPLYVTNLTDIEARFRILTPTGAKSDLIAKQDINRVWDVAYAVPANVREWLGGQSGIVSGTLTPHPTPLVIDNGRYFEDDAVFVSDATPLNGRGDPTIFVEVTPFQVHAKLGHYNTLVWVTRLATGAPLANARVRVYEDAYEGLTGEPMVLGEATTDASGIAMLPGRTTLDPSLAKGGYGPRTANHLMVRVDDGKDLAVLPLSYDFQIDTYRASRGQVWSNPLHRDGHTRAWGTTAQGVYKLGDTVQFKLYVRNQSNLTLVPVTERDGYQLDIVDPTGKSISTTKAIQLSQFGAYASEFKVPPTAAVGWYEFRLSRPAAERGRTWTPMRVLVADFTPAPFQVQTTVNGPWFQPQDNVEVGTQASLYAGGPYADAGTRVTARVTPTPIEVKAPAAAGFAFDSTTAMGYCDRTRWTRGSTVHESEAAVDENGALTTQFTVPDTGVIYGRMELESAVRDERGKYVASRVTAGYRGRDRFVGLRNSRWTFEEDKPASVEYLVADAAGNVAVGAPVSIEIRREVVTAARVKGAGNAYLTTYDHDWREAGSCNGTSQSTGRVCQFTPSDPGIYSVQASVDDTRGRTHTTQLCLWVTGKGRVLWDEPEDMSLSLIPEKPVYNVGDRARYLVRNPFPGARALVTIERFGVLKSWVQTLDGNTPIIDFPVEPDYLPGFYLSVLVMSPRVAPVPRAADEPDAAGVDLGRPTYRLGYTKVDVSDPYKALDVKIRSDQEVYKPRATVKLELQATSKHRTSTREPVELAVVVLDEAVFDLIQDGKSYFDPYRGFYQLDALDLVNYGLLNRLVGLMKFEKKGANAGGDGGSGFDMRAVSKYVAYWNPTVATDSSGRAKLEFQLPDNLTSWRVFAVAVTPGDRLGLGDHQFKSNKSTELRPIMPNQLAVGDRFTAGFSVLNRADKTRTVEVEIHASGPIEGGKKLLRKTLTLAPFKRESVWLPLQMSGDGTVKLAATAGDELDGDGLTHTIAVAKRFSLEVGASYGTTTDGEVKESILYPPNMQEGVGALSVLLSPSVLGNLDGTLRFARDYPYDCWEQSLTRALMAVNYRRLRSYFSATLQWPEAETLPQSVLDDAASFQAPNGGMGFFKADDARVSPYLSAATALAFNELAQAGYKVPLEVEAKLHAYLQRFLREDAAPTFYSKGMVSTVRAVALLALAERSKAQLSDLERYREQTSRMDLFGLAAYLRASLQVTGGSVLAAETAQRILSHSNQSAGKFEFTERFDDGYRQILATPLRSQCAILQAFSAYAATPAGASLVGDVPFKLVRAITQARGQRDHWENTQENLYCLNGLSAYSRTYEQQTPALSGRVVLGEESLGTAKFADVRDAQVTLQRANRAGDAGTKRELKIEREGQGRLYYATRLSFAPTDASATEVNAGIEITREYSVKRDGVWQRIDGAFQLARGEVVRVDLFVSLPAARHFVVVDDPIPGGLEPVNRDLATASTVDADAAEFEAAGGSAWFRYGDWSEYGIELWSFYHREFRHDAARFYADYLSAGHYHLSYAAQAIAAGEFTAPPARSEEMYDPDVYGKSLPVKLVIGND